MNELKIGDVHKPHGGFKSIIPLLLLTGIFFTNFISRIIFAPIMPEIEKDLEITHAQAGSIFFLISIGFFISLIGSGFVASRINHRRTILISAFSLGAVMILLSFSKTVFTLFLGALLIGLSAGLYLPSGISVLTTTVDKRHWGKAIAVHELAPNLSFVVAPIIAEVIMQRFPWQRMLTFTGMGAILFGILFMSFSNAGYFRGEAPGLRSIKEIVSIKSFWLMLVLFSMAISGTLGIFNMLPLYLVSERGFEQGWANTIIGLSRISGLFMAFASGWITDRVGPATAMRYVFIISGIFTLSLGIVPDSFMTLMVFIQPVVAVCFFPAGFNAISRIVSPEIRNLIVSLTIPPAFVVGSGVISAFIGFMGDMGSFSLGIIGAGLFIFCGSIVTKFLDID